MQFIQPAAMFVLRQLPAAAKTTVKLSARGIPVIARPALAFSRALVTGTVKTVTLPGGAGVKVSTIGLAARSGLQVRQVAVVGARAAVRTPLTVAKAAAIVPRTLARDAIRVVNPFVNKYRIYSQNLAERGTTTILRRVGDPPVRLYRGVVNRFGLDPTLLGNVISLPRFALYATIYKGYSSFGETYDGIRGTIGNVYVEASKQAEQFGLRFAEPIPVVPVDVVRPYLLPVVPSPVDIPRPIPVLPPQLPPQLPSGRIILPPGRRGTL